MLAGFDRKKKFRCDVCEKIVDELVVCSCGRGCCSKCISHMYRFEKDSLTDHQYFVQCHVCRCGHEIELNLPDLAQWDIDTLLLAIVGLICMRDDTLHSERVIDPQLAIESTLHIAKLILLAEEICISWEKLGRRTLMTPYKIKNYRSSVKGYLKEG